MWEAPIPVAAPLLASPWAASVGETPLLLLPVLGLFRSLHFVCNIRHLALLLPRVFICLLLAIPLYCLCVSILPCPRVDKCRTRSICNIHYTAYVQSLLFFLLGVYERIHSSVFTLVASLRME